MGVALSRQGIPVHVHMARHATTTEVMNEPNKTTSSHAQQSQYCFLCEYVL